MPGQITYYTFDLMTGTLLAELPLTGVTWAKRLNAAGQLSGSLDIGDPRVKKLNPSAVTETGRTMLIVDVDGAIEWGGIIWTRTPKRSNSQLAIGAIEFESYFTSRVQAADYTSTSTSPGSEAYWSSFLTVPDPGTDACYIAAQVVADAIAVSASALSGMTINIYESQANPNPIVETYPITQVQTVESILQQLAAGGYGTGFDYGFDVSWSGAQGSTPAVALNISYPRRGRIAGSTGLTITEPIIDYEWDENSTTQGNNQYGVASSSSLYAQQGPDPAVTGAGWPLLEQVQSFTGINTQSALNAATSGAVAQLEWPIVTPKITVPLFGQNLALGDFIMGDDVRVILSPDSWFTSGLDTYMRITEMDVTAADSGLSTMAITCGQPPGQWPVPAPPL